MHFTVQETQPPGIGSTGSQFYTPTATLGYTGPYTELNILTPHGALKVLLVGRVFVLDSGDNERSGVVPGNVNCPKLQMTLLVNCIGADSWQNLNKRKGLGRLLSIAHVDTACHNNSNNEDL